MIRLIGQSQSATSRSSSSSTSVRNQLVEPVADASKDEDFVGNGLSSSSSSSSPPSNHFVHNSADDSQNGLNDRPQGTQISSEHSFDEGELESKPPGHPYYYIGNKSKKFCVCQRAATSAQYIRCVVGAGTK